MAGGVETVSEVAERQTGVWADLVFMTGLGMVLLFLLTLATRNRAFYADCSVPACCIPGPCGARAG